MIILKELKKCNQCYINHARKEAEKSVREDYGKWKAEQKELEEEKRYRNLKSFRIEHYLGYLVQEGKYGQLTDQMKSLHAIYDQWNISINNYPD